MRGEEIEINIDLSIAERALTYWLNNFDRKLVKNGLVLGTTIDYEFYPDGGWFTVTARVEKGTCDE